MSRNSEKTFDARAALRLIDPKAIGVPLVPLAEVELHRSNFFWSAVFFGFFSMIVGSLGSLITTNYDNSPVVYILGLFLISYFILFVVFTTRGFVKWRHLRREAIGPGSWNQDSLGERVGALERTIQLLKIHRDIGMHIFKSELTLPLQEFKDRLDALLPLESDDPRRRKFDHKLQSEGIISIDKTDPENWMVNYEYDFDVIA